MKEKEPNYWHIHHESLGDEKKIKIRTVIEELCGWSTATFYRKKKDPDSLTPIERDAVVKAYDKEIKDFFPNNKPIAA